jgi:hypothetical protein
MKGRRITWGWGWGWGWDPTPGMAADRNGGDGGDEGRRELGGASIIPAGEAAGGCCAVSISTGAVLVPACYEMVDYTGGGGV